MLIIMFVATLSFFDLCPHYHIGLFHQLKKINIEIQLLSNPLPLTLVKKKHTANKKGKISTIPGFKSFPSIHL